MAGGVLVLVCCCWVKGEEEGAKGKTKGGDREKKKKEENNERKGKGQREGNESWRLCARECERERRAEREDEKGFDGRRWKGSPDKGGRQRQREWRRRRRPHLALAGISGHAIDHCLLLVEPVGAEVA